MHRGWKTGLAVAVIFGASVASAPGALALTRSQADANALRLLSSSHQSSPTGIVLYGLPAPLARGAWVGAFNGPARASSLRLPARTWLFWEDDAPGALFAHPSRMLLLGDDGAHTITRLSWWPLIGHRPPPFLSPGAAPAKRYVVYRSPGATVGSAPDPVAWPPRSDSSPILADPASPPLQVGPADFAHDCLVTVGYAGTDLPNAPATLSKDFTGLTGWASSVGLRTVDGGDTARSMQGSVSGAIATGCQDVFLFIGGHGRAGTGRGAGPPSILSRYSSAPDGGVDTQFITPADIAATLAAHDRTKPVADRATFKVKIISCYSGRFEDTLSHALNVEFYELSSAATEKSWLHLQGATVHGRPVANQTDNPAGVSEFMNRNLHGLQAWSTSQQAHNLPDLANGLANAFTLGATDDFAAVSGLTHPIKHYSPGAVETTFPPEPKLSPIHAVFTPAPPSQPCGPGYCTTVYTESATGDGLSFSWALSIPSDPGCAKGFEPGRPAANQATWYHADESEAGPCNHSGNTYDASGSGHPGTVTVTVANRDWSCTASFSGTQGPQGQPTYDGPAPQPCRPK